MEYITNILYWLTTGLLVPVIVFLLFFFVKGLIMIGGFYGTYLKRMKVNVKLNKQIGDSDIDEFLSGIDLTNTGDSSLMQHLKKIKDNSDKCVMLDKLLGDYEILSDKELGKSKLLVKIGPMLGLMGTLIPMGPALVGLSTGDVASMANNLQVAFATTVIGIVIGAIGFITLQVKQRWVADDMNILEYVVESLKSK